MENQIDCPKCLSTQIAMHKKGFSLGKAAAGVIVTGGIGALAGTIGSNKMLNTCMKCGFQFRPQDYAKIKEEERRKKEMRRKARTATENSFDNGGCASMAIMLSLLLAVVAFILFFNKWYVLGGIVTVLHILILTITIGSAHPKKKQRIP